MQISSGNETRRFHRRSALAPAVRSHSTSLAALNTRAASISLQKKLSSKPAADPAHCRSGRPAEKCARIPRKKPLRDRGGFETAEQTTGGFAESSGEAGVLSFIFDSTSSSSRARNYRPCGSTAAGGCRRRASTRCRCACRSSAGRQCGVRRAPTRGNRCLPRHA